MHKILFMNRNQTCGDLARNFQSDLWLKSSAAFDKVPKRLPFHILHRIEIAVTALPKMKHRRNIRMTHARRRPCLPYKAPASRFVADKPRVNHLQRHLTLQIDIDRFVSHPHSPPTELKRRSIFQCKELVMVEP